jgi:hypothetical protein
MTGPLSSRVLAPGDPLADPWLTRTDCKIVLAVLPHLQAATRLIDDVLPHLESDARVQVVLSVPDTGYRWAGFDEFVRGLDGLVVPWHQARQIDYDLVLAACHWGVAETKGPKVILPHGVGSVRSRIGPVHDGQIIPGALVLAHDRELLVLRQSCPEALPSAVIAGDPCFDRLVLSRPSRRIYRSALGLHDNQKLVFATSTWSQHSLFGRGPAIFERLAVDLPSPDYRTIAALHPFIWYGHGRRQVLAWLASARESGLIILPPEESWRAAVVAADLVVGDHGSVTQYAAGYGAPVLVNATSLVDVRPGSTADVLGRTACLLHQDQQLLPQLDKAMHASSAQHIAHLITARPGQSAAILRRTCYDLMNLAEPEREVEISEVPPAVPV